MSRFRLSTRTKSIVVAGMLAIGAMFALIQFQVGGSNGVLWVSDLGEPLVIAVAGVFTLYVAYRLGVRTLGRSWLALGLASIVFAGGDLVWAYIELIQGREVPYPGAPDYFYVAIYPLLFAGLTIALLGYRNLVSVGRPVLIATVTAVVLTVALYFGFLRDNVLVAGGWNSAAWLSALYPAADVVFAFAPALATALVVARLGGGKLGWQWWAVIAGVLSYVVADSGYAYLAARDLYQSGMVIDYGWSLANVLIAFGASIALDFADPSSWRRTSSAG